MVITTTAEYYRAYPQKRDEDPRAPAGGLGLTFHQPGAPFDHRNPDVSDCIVDRPREFRIWIWEPLRTKAPGPHLALPFCCYLKTVIFYHRPYIRRLARRYYRTAEGLMCQSTPTAYEQWDQIETRLTWDDLVVFDGVVFEKGGGTVLWARGRWWMRHGARRVQSRVEVA